jgi:ketosteroid isomerase-like protein
MKTRLAGFLRDGFLGSLTAVILILAISSGAAAQQKKKKGENAGNPSPAPPSDSASVSNQIEHDIGEMLGAFQVGDVEAMHKYYADNAMFVSGSYEPPVEGWSNYVALYQQQKAAFQGMQLIRRNTFIFVHQDVSWASYQWQFDSTFNGKPFTAQGQTTLVLNKVGDNWLIVHNHTSQICPGEAPSTPQPQQQPQQP